MFEEVITGLFLISERKEREQNMALDISVTPIDTPFYSETVIINSDYELMDI